MLRTLFQALEAEYPVLNLSHLGYVDQMGG